jgi:uncharacterized protein YheU (UPF0270 family)
MLTLLEAFILLEKKEYGKNIFERKFEQEVSDFRDSRINGHYAISSYPHSEFCSWNWRYFISF